MNLPRISLSRLSFSLRFFIYFLFGFILLVLLVEGGYYWWIVRTQKSLNRIVIEEGKFKGVEIPEGVILDNLGIRFIEREGKRKFVLIGVVREVDKKQRNLSVERNPNESSENIVDITVTKDTVFYQWYPPNIRLRSEKLEGDKFGLIKTNRFISLRGRQEGNLLISDDVVLY